MDKHKVSLYKVKRDQLYKIAPLFETIDDSMVIACLQGYMGEAFIPTEDDPEAGLVVSGEYSFLGGDPDTAAADYLIENLFNVIQSDETTAIFAEDKPGWEKKLLGHPENNPVAVPRYRIKQRNNIFDENNLQKYINAVPDGFCIMRFNEEIYDQAMREDWSKEFCETFDSADDYLRRGFGFAILHEGKLVSGASTMTVYDGGTETQVATRENYRQRGLAMPCAASFIRECLKRKMIPHWDAATLISKKMAVALGYKYEGEYTTVHMHR